MGSGIYNEFSVVEADINHIQYLQDNLRNTDVRECLIHGATPFRALMVGIREDQAETYTALVNGKPAFMFGTVPIYEQMIANIWMLGTYELEKYPITFMKLSKYVIDYFQKKFYQLENVVPADHIKTLNYLDFLGFHIIDQPLMINGFKVLRFYRCKDNKNIVSTNEQPCYS